MAPRKRQEYCCPDCGTKWIAPAYRSSQRCLPCSEARRFKTPTPAQEKLEEIRALGTLADRIQDETRMPWERRYGR